MSDWKAKRFWQAAHVIAADGGYGITLDARPVKTPAKAPLVVPTRAMADAIAAEWDAQTGKIDPLTMPVTRGANAAIDKVAPQRDEVVSLLAAYGETDLLCYRAEGPADLIARQAAAWDPMLEWAADTLGARLRVGVGVMHIAQNADAIASLHGHVAHFDNFALAGVHDLISLSGSLVLALAVTQGAVTPDAAWRLSRIDEDWQITQWGADDDAAALTAIKKASFLDAANFHEMSMT